MQCIFYATAPSTVRTEISCGNVCILSDVKPHNRLEFPFACGFVMLFPITFICNVETAYFLING